MNRKIKIGIVGCGMIGQVAHLANFVNLPNCEVVAAADLRPELGKLAVNKFHIPNLFNSHIEMIEKCDFDAAVVVTRRNATGPIVLDLIKAGKHVLSEKPMAHSVEQARMLVEEAEKNKLIYSIGFMKRYDNGCQKVKQIFDDLTKSEELGKILSLRCYCYGGEFRTSPENFMMSSEPRPDGLTLWRSCPEWLPNHLVNDYAWFLNVFIHDINLMRFLIGVPLRVKYLDFRQNNGRTILFDSELYPIILETAEQSETEWTEGIEVQFEYGRLKLALNSPLVEKSAQVELVRRKEIHKIDIAPGWAFSSQAEAFIEDIINTRVPLTSGRDSLIDMEIVEDIWRNYLEIEQ